MKALALTDGYGINALHPIERDDPTPGPDEIIVRTRAASLNYRDLEIVSGTFFTRFPLPLIPLSDGVGHVIAVGENVSRVCVGDRVAGTFWQRWDGGDFRNADTRRMLGGPIDGWLADTIRLDAGGSVLVPRHLSDAEAATLPCAGLTAWHCLIETGNLQPGETVLVQGTGGVAMFAVQFALMAGARPIVLSSSDAKLERVQTLGVPESDTVNYRVTPEWHEAVLARTDGRGVDHVIEVGGGGTLQRSLKALRVGGQIHLIGYLAGRDGGVNPLEIFARKAVIRPASVGSRGSFEAMNRALAVHGLHPIVDQVLPWQEAPDAFRALEAGAVFGKVALAF
ncbi:MULTISPECIES: NAD(P)-dependent alcohol dehydrogenase [Ralstonia]|uniref:zinc-dependent alcohol dehydrogenase family protein n=1 Tax=Ralstonia TaxID=48736 RepID=UPI000B083DE4|nr:MULTISPECIES: NAD(P)-dependent alcohol dehydrogenase [Ralstonia]PLT19850.1 NAD(P)-dependent alcohol dehydrogenase [Ralstonia mannitolilytica]